MTKNRAGSVLALTAAVAVALTAAASGQAAQAPTQSQMDQLLAEVRAIRADLDRAAASSMRGQLLGMRLQLQEQRIAAIARQLSDVQERLRANTQWRSALLGPLKMFGAMSTKDPASTAKPEEFDFLIGPMKQQLAALDKSDAELKAEEIYLTNQLQDEQSRWNAFNAQIEELERVTTSRAGK